MAVETLTAAPSQSNTNGSLENLKGKIMATTTTAPNFVEQVATLFPQIMEIPVEGIRKLVAVTYLGMARIDSSYSYENAVSEVMGSFAQAGDVQKVMDQTRIAKQKKTAEEFGNILRPFVMAEALKLPESDRPLTFAIVFDYSKQMRNVADDSPMLDSSGNQVIRPDFSLNLHWTKNQKKTGNTTGVDGRGRKPGYYLFPGKDDHFSSMGKFAKEVAGYDPKSGTPTRQYLESKGYEIPTDSVLDSNNEPYFKVTLKESPAAN